jgi:hypothetical protein
VDISASGGHVASSLIAPHTPEDPDAIADAIARIQAGEDPTSAAASATSKAKPQQTTTIATKAKIKSLLHLDHSQITLSRTHEAHRNLSKCLIIISVHCR